MKPEEWNQLSYRDQRARWPVLTPEDRAAIQSADATRADLAFFAVADRKYQQPPVCLVFNICGFLSIVAGLFMIPHAPITVVGSFLGGAVSLFISAAVASLIGRVAFYTQQTAELLARSNLAPAAPPPPAPPPVGARAEQLVAESTKAIQSMRELYGHGPKK